MSLQELLKSDDLRTRFESAGYTTLKELQSRSIIQLAQDIELTEEEIAIVGSLLNEGTETLQLGVSAAKLVKEYNHGITTNCQRLDQLFAPIQGIPGHGITEISGPPGSGKTQLCIQLSLNVQQPMNQGGLGGGCIYIDTEGGLMNERFRQMSHANEDPEMALLKLQNIHLFRVLDHLEMVALVQQLPDVLKECGNIKLIIIDSISYHLRLNIRNHRTRIGFLNFIGQNLIRIANQFNVPIVATNQAAPDMVFDTMRPTLGESWSQWCGNRLLLTRRRHQRYATMYSAPQQTSKTIAPFSVTQSGIGDVDEEIWARMQQWQESVSNMGEESFGRMGEWPGLDLDVDHYNLENDHSPWTTMGNNENESLENQDDEYFTDENATDIPPEEIPDDDNQQDEQEENYVLAPDSQPEQSYVDLSVYFGTQTSPIRSSRRRQSSSSTNVSISKRHRSLGGGSGDINDNLETVYDSQGDTDWMHGDDGLYLSASRPFPRPP